MKVGFTGTQIGMTENQKREVFRILSEKNVVLAIHGDCIGADSDFHELAKLLNITVEIHPPINESKRAFCKPDILKDSYPYLERNKHIVDACDIMIATPKSSVEELRSGTWATVRYARKRNKLCIIIDPEGKLIDEAR